MPKFSVKIFYCRYKVSVLCALFVGHGWFSIWNSQDGRNKKLLLGGWWWLLCWYFDWVCFEESYKIGSCYSWIVLCRYSLPWIQTDT